MTSLKRIIKKDIPSIHLNKLNDSGIYVEFNEENLFEAKALIKGPKDSLYEGGFLFFNITFPKNYPFSPPDLSYVGHNIRIHPNIYVSGHQNGFGKVCLSILGTWSGPKWTTIMDISSVLLTIQSLLDNNPLYHEPGFNHKNNKLLNNNYNEIIFYETIHSLCIKNILYTPDDFICFKNIITDSFNENYNLILNKLKNQIIKNKKPFKILLPYYRIHLLIDYNILYNRFINLQSNLQSNFEKN